jgi:hypothetical protein
MRRIPNQRLPCGDNLKEDAMRNMILLGAISLAATVVVAGDNIQPLNVKAGLWQVTTTMTIQGMGAPKTQTYKSCVTKENMNQYPFADPDNDCKYKVQSSTGTHMDVSGSCVYQGGGKADFKIQVDVIDTEHAHGSGQLTLAGPEGTMHGDYSGKGKWLAASCPAGTK